MCDEFSTHHDLDRSAIVSLGRGFTTSRTTLQDVEVVQLASLLERKMTPNRLKAVFGDRYLQIQNDLGKAISLDDASEDVLEFFEIKSEEKFRDIEEVTRFLLMNADA